MKPDDLERALNQWGLVYGEWGGVQQEERSLTGNSSLASFGRPAGYIGRAEKRSGKARRMLLGRGAGLKAANGRTLMAPAEYIDPISCTATRTYRAPDFDRRETLEVTKIQDAWLVLNRTLPLLAEVLRTQYQTRGCQQDKAERLCTTVRQYKEEIKLARVWMSGQLAK